MIEPQASVNRADTGARYLVLASLPYLPRFDHANRLPIGRETLRARLSLLPVADMQEISLALSLMSWERYPAGRTDAEIVAECGRVMRLTRSEGLRRLTAFRLGMRTIVAALRRRCRGLPPPQRNEKWGLGPWVRHIERHYGDPDFGLQHRLPWVPVARRLLEQSDAVELERLLFGLVWAELDRMTAANRFGRKAVLGYVFKWDLLDRWLKDDAASASQRFDALASEALHELSFARAA
jgi:hypothetical protein